MADRRRFLKSIAGVLVASAMPKSILDNTKPKVKFHEPKPTDGLLAYIEKHKTTISMDEIMKNRTMRMNEMLEKSIWAGNFTNEKK